jgi:hypothetical protein
MARHHSWSSYYLAFVKQCGKECGDTWRGEVLASAITIGCVYAINRSGIDVNAALLATAYTVGVFVFWHAIRVPWILYQKIEEADRLKSIWFVAGTVFLTGSFALLAWTAAWFYTMQPRVHITCAPDGRNVRITQLEAALQATSIDESPNSLRRRTARLAAELDRFWREVPLPPVWQPPNPNPVTDKDKKLKEAWDKYQRNVKAKYDSHALGERILGIIAEYQNKGVPTVGFERFARDRMIGGIPGPGLQPGDVLCGSEVC